MLIISNSPSVFLTEPAIEDSRLDFDYSNPDYQNSFDSNLKITCIGKYLIEATYGTSEKCHDSKQEGDVAVLRMNNILNACLDLDNLVYIKRAVVLNNLLVENDILINRTNSKELVGKCAVYENQIEASYASYLIRLRVDEKTIIPKFVVLYLTSGQGRNEINKRSCGTANQYNISIGHIKSFAIPDISVAKQESIIYRYSKANEWIASIEKKALENENERLAIPKYLDRVFVEKQPKPQQLTDDTLSYQWQSGKDPICKIHTAQRNISIISAEKIQDRIDPRYYFPSRLREAVGSNPEDWGVLSDFAEVNRESYTSEGNLPHVAIDEMPDDPWEPFELSEGYKGQTTYLDQGDIAFSRLMPTIMNGKCFLSWTKMTGSPEFIRIRTSTNYQAPLLFWLKTQYVREFLLSNVRGSSASQKRFTEDDIASCPIPKALFDSPKLYIDPCNVILNKATESACRALSLRQFGSSLYNKLNSNIFKLLKDDYVAELEASAKEALK